MSDNIVTFLSLKADIQCQAVCTVRTPADQKQSVNSSVPIQQNISLLLQTIQLQYY